MRGLALRSIGENMDIGEIMARNISIGGKFFDPDTMRYWRTRVSQIVYQGRSSAVFFVTSDRPDPVGPRTYSVRVAFPCGMVATMGYDVGSRADAHKLAREWARTPRFYHDTSWLPMETRDRGQCVKGTCDHAA